MSVPAQAGQAVSIRNRSSSSFISAAEKMFEPEIDTAATGILLLFSAEPVPLVREAHVFEDLVLVHQSVDELDGVLHMDIVVHIPVLEQENALETLGVGQDRAKLVALLVLRRCIHVAFG